jgi:MFS family permease
MAPAMDRRWAMLGVVFLTRIAMGYQFQAVPSVSTFLVDEFRLAYAELGLLIGLFMLPGTVIALPGGLLGQRFGDRHLVLAGLLFMMVGGALTAAAPDFGTACGGRAASGIGASLLNLFLAKIVADWFAGRELRTALGVMLTAWPVGIGLALHSVGRLAEAASWRMAMHATVGVCAIAFGLMVALYREPPHLEETTPAAAGSLPRRDLWLALIAGAGWAAFNASLLVVVAFAPAILTARGVAVAESAMPVSAAIWITIVSVPLGGMLADRWKARVDAIIVGGALTTSGLILGIVLAPASVWSYALVGLALGVPAGALIALLPQAARPETLATAFGVHYSIYYLGMAAAQPAAGYTRDLTRLPEMPIVFAAALMAATALSLVGFRAVEGRGGPRHGPPHPPGVRSVPGNP